MHIIIYDDNYYKFYAFYEIFYICKYNFRPSYHIYLLLKSHWLDRCIKYVILDLKFVTGILRN